MGLFDRLSKAIPGTHGSSAHDDPAQAQQEYAARALYGPAGVAVYGPGPHPEPPHAPPPPHQADPSQQAAFEFHARAAARAPYLAPNRVPVTITRVASTFGEGVAPVAAHLASTGLSARPDLVFGVYQVPDHIGRSSQPRNERFVEWDVVHVPVAGLPPGPPPQAIHLDARHRWVARASSQPSILDEDLGVALLQWSGVGPEHVLGVARRLVSESGSGDSDDEVYARIAVIGVSLLAASLVDIGAVADRAAANAPLDLPAGPPAGVHVQCLNWRVVSRAVHPRTGAPFLVPSPFPYLPSTPQELLVAYLEIVGVAPADCYSAQVTTGKDDDIRDSIPLGPLVRYTDAGIEQPCIDGRRRPRLAAATVLLVAYRDRPEYATGRERWAAYERDVLLARLDRHITVRRPVVALDTGSLRRSARKALASVGPATAHRGAWPTDDVRLSRIPDARYCWPPTDAR